MLPDAAAAASGFLRGRLEVVADVDQFTGAGLEFRFGTAMEHFVASSPTASSASCS